MSTWNAASSLEYGRIGLLIVCCLECTLCAMDTPLCVFHQSTFGHAPLTHVQLSSLIILWAQWLVTAWWRCFACANVLHDLVQSFVVSFCGGSGFFNDILHPSQSTLMTMNRMRKVKCCVTVDIEWHLVERKWLNVNKLWSNEHECVRESYGTECVRVVFLCLLRQRIVVKKFVVNCDHDPQLCSNFQLDRSCSFKIQLLIHSFFVMCQYEIL